MNATQEEWRPVVGYEGRYDVSNLGRVRSVDREVLTRWGPRLRKGKILAASINQRTGYRVATLSDKQSGRKLYYALVHRLVLEAFVGPCPPGMECCHGDLDRSNAALSNLRWDTRSANTIDAVNHQTNHNARKTHCPNGHPYDQTYKRPDGQGVGRLCSECKNARRRARTGGRKRSQTHCRRGHLITGFSIRSDGRPRRFCKECRRESERRYRERRRATRSCRLDPARTPTAKP